MKMLLLIAMMALVISVFDAFGNSKDVICGEGTCGQWQTCLRTSSNTMACAYVHKGSHTKCRANPCREQENCIRIIDETYYKCQEFCGDNAICSEEEKCIYDLRFNKASCAKVHNYNNTDCNPPCKAEQACIEYSNGFFACQALCGNQICSLTNPHCIDETAGFKKCLNKHHYRLCDIGALTHDGRPCVDRCSSTQNCTTGEHCFGSFMNQKNRFCGTVIEAPECTLNCTEQEVCTRSRNGETSCQKLCGNELCAGDREHCFFYTKKNKFACGRFMSRRQQYRPSNYTSYGCTKNLITSFRDGTWYCDVRYSPYARRCGDEFCAYGGEICNHTTPIVGATCGTVMDPASSNCSPVCKSNELCVEYKSGLRRCVQARSP